MGAVWYYKRSGQTHGPFTARELKQRAAEGDFTREALVRKKKDGKWIAANRVSGLFSESSSSASPPPIVDSSASGPPPIDEIQDPPPLIPPEGPISATTRSTKLCPFCAEEIVAEAVKCKHCSEFLDPALRQQASVQQRARHRPTPKWSPGIAAVLSLVIPGAGQLYKGQVGNGLVWLVAVTLGYLFFIVPGLVLHICCIVGATSGDPTR